MRSTSEQILLRSARLSVLGSFIVLGLKVFAYSRTGSTAILSDGLESIVNVIASIMALFVTKAVQAPADEEHPYGHGKLEYFSSAFEGGLVVFAAIAIAFGALRALVVVEPLSSLNQGLLLIGVAGVINLALGLHLLKVGRVHQSTALQASGKHVLSDVWSTIAVFAGLLLVQVTGWQWLDPGVALVVAAMLFREGFLIVRHAAGALIDEMEPGTLKAVSDALEKSRIPGIIDIHNLKIIRSGKFHHIDAHVVVPRFWNVEEAHHQIEKFEQAFLKAYPFEAEVAFHTDPCEPRHCASCALGDCTLRSTELKQPRDFTATRIIKGPRQEGDHD